MLIHWGPFFAEQRQTYRSLQRQREESDLLNVECCHGDDVIDVRASANLLHVGQVPFRPSNHACTRTYTQTHTNTQTEQVNI